MRFYELIPLSLVTPLPIIPRLIVDTTDSEESTVQDQCHQLPTNGPRRFNSQQRIGSNGARQFRPGLRIETRMGSRMVVWWLFDSYLLVTWWLVVSWWLHIQFSCLYDVYVMHGCVMVIWSFYHGCLMVRQLFDSYVVLWWVPANISKPINHIAIIQASCEIYHHITHQISPKMGKLTSQGHLLWAIFGSSDEEVKPQEICWRRIQSCCLCRWADVTIEYPGMLSIRQLHMQYVNVSGTSIDHADL